MKKYIKQSLPVWQSPRKVELFKIYFSQHSE